MPNSLPDSAAAPHQLRYAYNTNGASNHRLGDALTLIAEAGYDGVALTLDHHRLEVGADAAPLEPGIAPERVRQRVQLGEVRRALDGCAGEAEGAGGALVVEAGVADHARIGEGARLAAKSGVIGDVPAGLTVAGFPAVPRQHWLRAMATLLRRDRAPRTRRS